MNAHDAARDGARDQGGARCCSATAGSEPVDTDAVERLLLKVAQLKNDLPQVRELDLSLVIVGLARRHRAHRSAHAWSRPWTPGRTGTPAGWPSQVGETVRRMTGSRRVTD